MKLRHLLPVLLLLVSTAAGAYTFGQNKINYEDVDWSVIQTMHFDIYFPAGNDDFGKLAALMAEETYYTIRADLKFPAASRIPVIFYGSKTEFQSTNIIYPLLTESVGGFTESLRNRVVIPFEGSYAALEELLAHELTHAYINALDAGMINAFNALRPTSFPFWFSEGLPEFLSIGGEDNYNNMFILDMVVNDNLPDLESSDGYYAYRLGESFLTFIANTWGREKVAEYFFAIRSTNSLKEATRKIFGLEFEELQSRWRYQLKRDYFPTVNTHGIPPEDFEQRTFSEKDGSYFNFMPRFSPDGQRYVFFSTAGARYSIWQAGLYGLNGAKKVITGEATGSLEEFHYFRANLSWFPDSRRVAFVAKTSVGDRIQILDVDKGRILQTIRLPGLTAIYELDVAPDGESLVFAAQQGMQCDLWLYRPGTEELTRLTDDLYDEAQPRFSPDGNRIAFTSERSVNPDSKRQGFFSNLSSNVFSLELATGQFRQHTFGTADCSFPMYDSTGTRLIYLTEQDKIRNYRVLDLEARTGAEMSKVLSGIFSGDLSPDNQNLVVSNYFKGAWNIYLGASPLEGLDWQPAPAPVDVELKDELLSKVDLGRLDLYGRRERMRPKRTNPAPQLDQRRPLLGDLPEFEYTGEDSLRLERDFSYDDRPDSVGTVIPGVKPYRTKFGLDSLWGGLAYSSTIGTIGYVELGLSDMMGNHGIGINAEISGKLEESNILLSYLYLKHRIDYGLGVFNLVDETIYREYLDGPDNYYRDRVRQTGLYLLFRYPFSRFLRLDFDHRIYQQGRYWDTWDWGDLNDDEDDTWIEDPNPEQDFVYSPGLTLVHDNALYGSTGPLVGWRGMYFLTTTLVDGKVDYVTNYLDWRAYTLFSRRYALALRAIAGLSAGDHAQNFDLSGYYGVRAYDGDIIGHKKAVLSAELRFPFFDYISMAFPLPITVPNIRGSVFGDLGTVFDDYEDFRATNDGRLQDLYLGYGFGPRLNLGYVVLRFDIAWLSNLSSISKPTYYLSLSEDF
jgi:hypothetical protein